MPRPQWVCQRNTRNKRIPASELLLGIGFYGRGWTGITQAAV
ncbi:hypothetical protein [Dactylosporangium roseum]|nr:hypothetical protein [Dactylosporangium roseum]